jgi:hypothetical protein
VTNFPIGVVCPSPLGHDHTEGDLQATDHPSSLNGGSLEPTSTHAAGSSPTLRSARLRFAWDHVGAIASAVDWAFPVRHFKHPDLVTHTGKTNLGLRRKP